MDSLPPLSANSGSLVSMSSLPASRGDGPMSSDSCLLDIQPADAAELNDIITFALKDVDCGRQEVEATSLDMEHLSINDEDYKELVEDRKERNCRLNNGANAEFANEEKKSKHSLVVSVEDKLSEDKLEENDMIRNVKPIGEKADNDINVKPMTVAQPCIPKERQINDEVGDASKVFETESFLNDITEIISSPPPSETQTMREMTNLSDKKNETDFYQADLNRKQGKCEVTVEKTEMGEAVYSAEDKDSLSIHDPMTSPVVVDGSELRKSPAGSDRFDGVNFEGARKLEERQLSDNQTEKSPGQMRHVLEFDNSDEEEYEGSGLQNRGGSQHKGSRNVNKGNRPILPKPAATASTLSTVPLSNLNNAVVTQYPLQIHSIANDQIRLEVCPSTSMSHPMSIPSVVHDAINTRDRKVDTDGPPDASQWNNTPIGMSNMHNSLHQRPQNYQHNIPIQTQPQNMTHFIPDSSQGRGHSFQRKASPELTVNRNHSQSFLPQHSPRNGSCGSIQIMPTPIPSQPSRGDLVIADRHQLEKLGVPYHCVSSPQNENYVLNVNPGVQSSTRASEHTSNRNLSQSITQLPQHAMTNLPQHAMTNLPQHAMTNLPQHAMTNLPQHAMTNLPQHAMTNLPQHAMTNLPQHAMTNLPQHAMTNLPQHAMTNLPIRVTQPGCQSTVQQTMNISRHFVSRQPASNVMPSPASSSQLHQCKSAGQLDSFNPQVTSSSSAAMPFTLNISTNGNLMNPSFQNHRLDNISNISGVRQDLGGGEISPQSELIAQLHLKSMMTKKHKPKRLGTHHHHPHGENLASKVVGKTLPESKKQSMPVTENIEMYPNQQSEECLSDDILHRDLELRQRRILSEADCLNGIGTDLAKHKSKSDIGERFRANCLPPTLNTEIATQSKFQQNPPRQDPSCIGSEDLHLSGDLQLDLCEYLIDASEDQCSSGKVTGESMDKYLNNGKNFDHQNINGVSMMTHLPNDMSGASFDLELPSDLQNMQTMNQQLNIQNQVCNGGVSTNWYGHDQNAAAQMTRPNRMCALSPMSSLMNGLSDSTSHHALSPGTGSLLDFSRGSDVSMGSENNLNDLNCGNSNATHHSNLNIVGGCSSRSRIVESSTNIPPAGRSKSAVTKSEKSEDKKKKKSKKHQSQPISSIQDWVNNGDWLRETHPSDPPMEQQTDLARLNVAISRDLRTPIHEQQQQMQLLQQQQLRQPQFSLQQHHQQARRQNNITNNIMPTSQRNNNFNIPNQQSMSRVQSQSAITPASSSSSSTPVHQLPQNNLHQTIIPRAATNLSTKISSDSHSRIIKKKSNTTVTSEPNTTSHGHNAMYKSNTVGLRVSTILTSNMSGTVQSTSSLHANITSRGCSSHSSSNNARHRPNQSSNVEEPSSLIDNAEQQKGNSSVEYIGGDSDLQSYESGGSSLESKQRFLEFLEPDEEQDTPLHYLCEMPDDMLVKYLEKLKNHKKLPSVINHLNSRRETALFVAVMKRNVTIVNFLVRSKANVNIVCQSDSKEYRRNSRELQTALHEAVESGDKEIIKILLRGCETDVDSRRNGSNMTPLMLALSCHSVSKSRSNQIKIIDILLKHGASLEVEDWEGKSPLMYMVMSGDVHLVRRGFEIVGVQLARSLVTAVTKRKKETCLHFAADLQENRIDSLNKKELLKLLIQHGADPDKPNSNRQTPRQLASTEINEVMNQLKTVTDSDSTPSTPRSVNSDRWMSPAHP